MRPENVFLFLISAAILTTGYSELQLNITTGTNPSWMNYENSVFQINVIDTWDDLRPAILKIYNNLENFISNSWDRGRHIVTDGVEVHIHIEQTVTLISHILHYEIPQDIRAYENELQIFREKVQQIPHTGLRYRDMEFLMQTTKNHTHNLILKSHETIKYLEIKVTGWQDFLETIKKQLPDVNVLTVHMKAGLDGLEIGLLHFKSQIIQKLRLTLAKLEQSLKNERDETFPDEMDMEAEFKKRKNQKNLTVDIEMLEIFRQETFKDLAEIQQLINTTMDEINKSLDNAENDIGNGLAEAENNFNEMRTNMRTIVIGTQESVSFYKKTIEDSIKQMNKMLRLKIFEIDDEDEKPIKYGDHFPFLTMQNGESVVEMDVQNQNMIFRFKGLTAEGEEYMREVMRQVFNETTEIIAEQYKYANENEPHLKNYRFSYD